MLRCGLLILASGAMLIAQSTASVQGHVFSTEGTRLGAATVTIAGASTYVAVTETGTDPGHYNVASIPNGTYSVSAAKEGYRSSQPRAVTVQDAAVTVDFVLEPSCSGCAAEEEKNKNPWGVKGRYLNGLLTVTAVMLYFASILLAHWHNIARPNRELLNAEIDNHRARFQNESGIELHFPEDQDRPLPGSREAQVLYLDRLLKAASAAIEWNTWSWNSWFDFFFWTRGQEITGWTRIYEFERASVKYLATVSPLDTIRARLQAITLDLLEMDKAHAKAFAANIRDALAAQPPDINALRALLVEALTFLNDDDTNTFAQLVGWQTKAVWLATLGCGLIVVLAVMVGNPVLFVAGATGGFLSRLSRTLKRADVPTDYGASWTTLFLSPIVGALSGWFGILLIVVLADSKLNVLGTAFQSVKWYCPLTPIPLGLAFALGFSERMFDGILTALDEKVDSDLLASKKNQEAAGGVFMAKKDGQQEQGK